MIWRRFFALFALNLVFSLFGCVAHRACQIPQEILGQVEEQRGLRFREPVPCQVADEGEIGEYLKRALHRQNPPERLFYEGIAWKMLGLLPPDFDYVEQVLRLYTRRIEAFYDPERKHFVILAGATAHRKKAIMVHELTHALQDQHYGLLALTRGDYSSDELLARISFIEGDAQRITYRSAGRLVCESGQSETGQSEASDEQFLKLLQTREAQGAGYYQARALEQMMSFPYTFGLRFSCQMKRQLNAEEYEQLFWNPPQSTRKILHPELDSGRVPDGEVFPIQFFVDQPILLSDKLGEYVVSLMLSEFLPPAETGEAMAGFLSDSFVLIRKDNHYRLHWMTTWKNFADRERFSEALEQVLKLHSRRLAQQQSGSPFLNFNYTIDTETSDAGQQIIAATILAEPLPPPLARR